MLNGFGEVAGVFSTVVENFWDALDFARLLEGFLIALDFGPLLESFWTASDRFWCVCMASGKLLMISG